MFGTIDKSKGLLFVTHDLDHSIRLTLQKMQQEVEGLDENRLLNTPPEDLKRYLVEKYGITPITLQRDQWYADHEDVPVDGRQKPEVARRHALGQGSVEAPVRQQACERRGHRPPDETPSDLAFGRAISPSVEFKAFVEVAPIQQPRQKVGGGFLAEV